MPFIPLGENDWQSDDIDVTRLRVHNMYLVEDPQSADGTTRITRPSLDAFATAGATTVTISGVFRQEGVLGGDIFVVSGQSLYRVNFGSASATFIATLVGTGICQFTATNDKIIILRDGIAYYYDGTTFGAVLMPEPGSITSAAAINGYVLYVFQDTDTFYWSEPDQIDPDALSFATAERYADFLVAVSVISDEVWLLGKDGPEVWQATGDADLPFARIPGRVYTDGCDNVESVCAVTANNLPALMWVTDHRTVVVAQEGVATVSNDSVNELLKTATNLRAWAFEHNRHNFYVLTSDEFTITFDIDVGRWYRWDSYGEVNWKAHLGVMYGSTPVGVDSTSNNLWTLGAEGDDDGTLIVREISGVIPISGKPTPCNEVILKVNSGANESYTDTDIIEMRWSDDQGNTWNDYRSVSLGALGAFSQEIQFRSLGQMRRPGRIFEFRYSGTNKLRIDYATINEA